MISAGAPEILSAWQYGFGRYLRRWFQQAEFWWQRITSVIWTPRLRRRTATSTNISTADSEPAQPHITLTAHIQAPVMKPQVEAPVPRTIEERIQKGPELSESKTLNSLLFGSESASDQTDQTTIGKLPLDVTDKIIDILQEEALFESAFKLLATPYECERSVAIKNAAMKACTHAYRLCNRSNSLSLNSNGNRNHNNDENNVAVANTRANSAAATQQQQHLSPEDEYCFIVPTKRRLDDISDIMFPRKPEGNLNQKFNLEMTIYRDYDLEHFQNLQNNNAMSALALSALSVAAVLGQKRIRDTEIRFERKIKSLRKAVDFLQNNEPSRPAMHYRSKYVTFSNNSSFSDSSSFSNSSWGFMGGKSTSSSSHKYRNNSDSTAAVLNQNDNHSTNASLFNGAVLNDPYMAMNELYGHNANDEYGLNDVFQLRFNSVYPDLSSDVTVRSGATSGAGNKLWPADDKLWIHQVLAPSALKAQNLHQEFAPQINPKAPTHKADVEYLAWSSITRDRNETSPDSIPKAWAWVIVRKITPTHRVVPISSKAEKFSADGDSEFSSNLRNRLFGGSKSGNQRSTSRPPITRHPRGNSRRQQELMSRHEGGPTENIGLRKGDPYFNKSRVSIHWASGDSANFIEKGLIPPNMMNEYSFTGLSAALRSPDFDTWFLKKNQDGMVRLV